MSVNNPRRTAQQGDAAYVQFAKGLTEAINNELGLEPCAHSAHEIRLSKSAQEEVQLNLIPFAARADGDDMMELFTSVTTVHGLVEAYQQAKSGHGFEWSAIDESDYPEHARYFVDNLMQHCSENISNADAMLIAAFVRHLDRYAAIKSIESLVYNPADLALLHEAEQRGWQLHYDHMAIRCGSQANKSAEKVARLLTGQYGYVAAQIPSEVYYQFPDGWNAYPLYKMLENGQVIRLFIDQSDADNKTQIIQHWNHMYGFTAHHLGIRATKMEGGQRIAVPLLEIKHCLEQRGLPVMTPTGLYTRGMLEQVFTQPKQEEQLPEDILKGLAGLDAGLPAIIRNGKLLEIVSRREMAESLKAQYFALYGIEYEPDNPLHSAPVYQYFLPAQAAHVINTSVQTGTV